MKKLILLFAIAFTMSAASFGIDFSLSVGAGGLLGYTFTRYTLEDSGTMPGGGESGTIRSIQSMDRFDYGGFLFFDATYGELSILIQGGGNAYGETMDFGGSSPVRLADSKGTGTEMSLGFSLLGKFPFELTKKLVIFPLAGVSYHIALLEWRKPEGDIVYDRTKGELPEDQDKNGDAYPLSAWNSLWIILGAGIDYTIKGPWYLRGEALFGFRLPTGYENGALAMTKQRFSAPDPKLSGLTGNPTLKLAVGRRFFGFSDQP
ncbi:MAG: hypothetical protein LBG73_05760 [Spirochaetaceae bacterium]|jgi:hypothetical protein|nr:hypothetical protein [Spirochaetaceae bacterium]